MILESLEELFCDETNILTVGIIIFQYYKCKYNGERCVKESLKDLGSDVEVHENVEFIIKTLGGIFIVFIVVIVYFSKSNEFFAITVNLFCTEFLYDLVKGR